MSRLLLFLMLMLPSTALADELVEGDRVAAVVNAEPLTQRAVLQRARLERAYRQIANVDDPRAVTQRRRYEASILVTLIEETLVLQEARKRAVKFGETDKKDLEKELAARAEPYGGIDGLRIQLKKLGVSFEAFKAQIRANILKGKLFYKVITRDLFIPPARLIQFYREHPELYRREARTELRRIQLKADADRLTPAIQKWLGKDRAWDAKARLALGKELRGRIFKGEDPGLLARLYSMSRLGRERDGLYVFEDRSKEFAEIKGVRGLAKITKGLEEGDVSPPTPGRRDSIELVYLELKRARSLETYAAVQNRIDHQLKLEEWRRQVAFWTAGLKSRAVIRVYPVPNS